MTIYGRSARTLRRYGPWTMVVAAAAVAAAYGINRSVPAEYRSEASILVETRTAPDLETERALVRSDAVALSAAQRVGLGKSEMLGGLELEVVPGTTVLSLVYSADNRFTAQVRARALVEAYLNYRNPATASQAPAPASSSAAGPQLISPPSLPTEPYTRPLLPDLLAGFGAGLLLGAGTALIRARSRGLIRSREDFERLAGTTVLATVPRAGRPAGTTTGLPMLLRDPGSPAAEAYRYLRARLHPTLRTSAATTILVTSPGDRQGRTAVASNLAVALAQAGRSVVLVDADLRRPVQHQVFQVPGDYGLTTLLDGDATVSEVLEDTTVPGLRVLPAGHRTGEHVDLLEGPQLARVLRALQEHCDVVVLDSAAVLSASDAIALAALSDHVLLVGDFRRTSRGSVRRALAELAEVTDGNLNTVLLNLPKSAGGLAPRPREISSVAPAPFLYGKPAARPAPDDEDAAPPSLTVPVVHGTAVSSTLYSSAAALAAEDASDAGDYDDEEPTSAFIPGLFPVPLGDEAPESSGTEETTSESEEEDRTGTAVLEPRS
ncbi:polysaccharide biosynthesis tyrosine autokinase [Actinoplanes sp. NPDC051861]|uniref:polysaccharide biosynthesis tyrosine autokinase n=1 Tax=Actinoplanes sp. NPDC051861 TaxID=3155170 RepID=UPI00343D0245